MRNELEKRISRLEKREAKSREEPKVCNCRVQTRFHNAECLVAVLKGIPWVCPIHGFRNLGRLLWTPEWGCLSYRNGGNDNQFCPCRPHPWRSFVLSDVHTWEKSYAAKEAWHKLEREPMFSFEEEGRRITSVWEKYWEACEQWFEQSGRRLPSPREIVKQGTEGVPKLVG
jgi:hypothetical protein